MFVQQHRRRRPEDGSAGGGEAGLRHPLYAPLLCQFWRDAQEPGRLHTLAGPCARRKVVPIGSKLDGEIARVHGATIPLQPEAQMALPHAVCGEARPVGDGATGLPPGSAVRTPRLLPCYLWVTAIALNPLDPATRQPSALAGHTEGRECAASVAALWSHAWHCA